MTDERAYDRLLDAIYAAALDASRWPDALESIRAETGDVGVLLGIGRDAATYQPGYFQPKDPTLSEREVFPLLATTGMDMTLWPIFLERHLDNPVSAGIDALKMWRPTEASQHIDRKEIVRTDVYREVFEPQDILDNTNVVLAKSPGELRMLVSMRSERTDVVDPSKPLLARLAPHLARSLEVMHSLGATAETAALFAATLAESSRVAFMLDASGAVVETSPNADRFVGETSPFRITKQGGLRLSRVADTARLNRAIAAAVSDVGASSPSARPAIVNAVDPVTYRNMSIVVLPARAIEQSAVVSRRVAAIVVARDASWGVERKVEIVMAAYGLTRREAQVAVSLIEAGSLPSAARRLGVKLSTAQSHMKSSFRKVGASSQVELVARLCADFSQLANA